MTFKNLNRGDLFSSEGGDNIYIKIESGEIEGGYIFNCADISTGSILWFDETSKVERVLYSDIIED